MYNYNPYMPYMPGDMCDPSKKDYMYGADEYMPMGMPMNLPMNMPMSMPMNLPMNMPMGMPMGCMNPYFKKEKCLKVPEVIGRNCCQILLETEIPFDPRCPALEIKDITKEVTELDLCICKDKVLVNGKLHKNINYKTLDTCGKVKCCCNELDLYYGDVKHVSVTIPFNGYINLPGARPGDKCEVEFAGVEDGCEEDVLIDHCYIKGFAPRVYKKVREKVIVKIDVKVLRHVQITVDPKMPNICP